MVKIHGIVYFIVGIAVALYSYKVNPEKLITFIWIGIAFAVFGLIKILISRIKKPKRGKTAKQQSAKKFCLSCGTALHQFQKFCHNCGQRMFHK